MIVSKWFSIITGLNDTLNDYIIPKKIIKDKFHKKIIIFKKKKDYTNKCRII